ncbi:MAG TPA: hypothetical protein VK027_00270 [Chitinophagaceae bacterium]|nr:hypothetical protein [Chitinophagaceae bacterium]
MTKHKIELNVTLDADKMPEHIDWIAPGGGQDTPKPAKSFLLSLWDPSEKTALSIDLWTKRMMVDEMNDFFFQTMMSLAKTYENATTNQELAEELRTFAHGFKRKADEKMMKDQESNQ